LQFAVLLRVFSAALLLRSPLDWKSDPKSEITVLESTGQISYGLLLKKEFGTIIGGPLL